MTNLSCLSPEIALMSVTRYSERECGMTCPRPQSRSIEKFQITPRSPNSDLSFTTSRGMGQNATQNSQQRVLEIACHMPWRWSLCFQRIWCLLLLLMGVAPLLLCWVPIPSRVPLYQGRVFLVILLSRCCPADCRKP